jgi:hypothetical protein
MNWVRRLWLVFAVVQVDDERCDADKTLFDTLASVDKTIYQAVAENDGCHPVQKESIGSWQENPHRRHRRCCLKIVVGG